MRNAPIVSRTITPLLLLYSCLTARLKKGNTKGLKCMMYTAKHAVANRFMIVL